uniref:hypothetical protein n=1 Tax=Altererythrobacter segetis TaxID=1104773 RepID=UPI00140A9281|nr:hypothetical protein [Altererythrobacter segetis]
MPYFIRVLSPEARPVPARELASAVEHLNCHLTGDVSSPEWAELEVTDKSGRTLFAIERSEVREGSLARDELLEFEEEVSESEPVSAANWLCSYLPTVRTIYAFQILDAIYSGNGWEVLGAVRNTIWAEAGGVIQADGEGFSNEDGYHILWQFSDDVTGDWWMAVLDDGDWVAFQMDLGNPAHRSAFKAGRIPDGVQLA